MPNSRDLNRRRRTLSLTARAAVTVAISALLLSCQDAGTPQTTGSNTSPSTSSSSTPSPSASSPSPTSSESATTTEAAALDTATWTPYTSTRYDLELAYPPDWNVEPAERARTLEDAGRAPEAMDHFDSPDGTIRVSVWSVPVEPEVGIGSDDQLIDWVQTYCSGFTAPCSELGDRAVDLCRGEMCGPLEGVLVTFNYDVQAFLSGPPFAQDAITVIAVWRSPFEPLTAPYLQSQRLLEAFLSTMDVWVAPATR